MNYVKVSQVLLAVWIFLMRVIRGTKAFGSSNMGVELLFPIAQSPSHVQASGWISAYVSMSCSIDR